MEDDAALQDHDVDHLGPLGRVFLLSTVLDVACFRLGGMPLQDTNAEILCKERNEDARHSDGTCCPFVTKLPQTFAGKHKLSVSKEMDEGSRDNDTGAELSEDGDEDIVWRDEAGEQNGTEDTDRAGCQHGEQETDSETDVVVPVLSIAC